MTRGPQAAHRVGDRSRLEQAPVTSGDDEFRAGAWWSWAAGTVRTAGRGRRGGPRARGHHYCAMIEACQDTFDLATGARVDGGIERQCAAKADLAPYRGQSLVYLSAKSSEMIHGVGDDAARRVDHLAVRARQRRGRRPRPPPGADRDRVAS
jgi:hypothetical protein